MEESKIYFDKIYFQSLFWTGNDKNKSIFKYSHKYTALTKVIVMKPICFAYKTIFSFWFSFDVSYSKYHWWERDQKFCYETLKKN